MNNQTVDDLFQECLNEFERIDRLIEVLTSTNPAVPFWWCFKKYAEKNNMVFDKIKV